VKGTVLVAVAVLAGWAGAAGPPAATVGKLRIDLAEVDARCREPCAKLRSEIASRKWAMVETVLGEALLAGMPSPPSPTVTPAEVDAYLADHAADFHGPPERDRTAVAFFLVREKTRATEKERIAAERTRHPPTLRVGAESPALLETSPDVVLADVVGRTIRNGDVEARLALPLYHLRGELQRERLQHVEAMIEEALWRAEAGARGTSVEPLRDDVRKSAPAVTEADVDRWYETSIRVKDPRAEKRPERIRPYLEFRAAHEAEAALLAAVRVRHPVHVALQEPEPPRLALDPGIGGWRGGQGGQAKVIFLTGYRGSGSRAMWPVVKELAVDPGVALAVRPLLPFWDPEATLVAAAVRCAAAQGKFWPFHDAVASREPLPDHAALARIAAELGLDPTGFGACLVDPATASAVAADSAAVERLGFEGAPAVIVNGRAFSGVQGLDRLRTAARDTRR
jgi:hypothetical protein